MAVSGPESETGVGDDDATGDDGAAPAGLDAGSSKFGPVVSGVCDTTGVDAPSASGDGATLCVLAETTDGVAGPPEMDGVDPVPALAEASETFCEGEAAPAAVLTLGAGECRSLDNTAAVAPGLGRDWDAGPACWGTVGAVTTGSSKRAVSEWSMSGEVGPVSIAAVAR